MSAITIRRRRDTGLKLNFLPSARGGKGDTGEPGSTSDAFLTRTGAIAATIPSTVKRIRTNGYAAAGDYGGAWHVYSSSAPSHSAYFRSLDGAYWVLDPVQVLRPEMFGAKGDGATDDTTAFQVLGAFVQSLSGSSRIELRPVTYKVLPNADPGGTTILWQWTDCAGITVNGNGARLLSTYVGDHTAGGTIQSQVWLITRGKNIHIRDLTVESSTAKTIDETYSQGGMRNYFIDGSTNCSVMGCKFIKHTVGVSFTRNILAHARHYMPTVDIETVDTNYSLEVTEGDLYDAKIKATGGYRAIIGHNIVNSKVRVQSKNMHFDVVNLSATYASFSPRAELDVDITFSDKESTIFSNSFVELGAFVEAGQPATQGKVSARVHLNADGGDGGATTSGGPSAFVTVIQVGDIPAAGHKLHVTVDGVVNKHVNSASGGAIQYLIENPAGTTNLNATRASLLVDLVMPDVLAPIAAGLDANKTITVTPRTFAPFAGTGFGGNAIVVTNLQTPTPVPESCIRVEGILYGHTASDGREITTPVFRRSTGVAGTVAYFDAASGTVTAAWSIANAIVADIFASTSGMSVRAYTGKTLDLYSNATAQWRLETTGTLRPFVTNTNDIGTSLLRLKKIWTTDLDASGNAVIGGTFGVTGAATFTAQINGSTLSLSGLATLASASVTGNATIGGTLGVTGLATLGSMSVTGNATITGTLGVTGLTTVAGLTNTGALIKSGVISPSQITADQNNYAPTGFATASILRLNSDASRSVTGLAGGATGREVVLINTGSFDIVLKDEANSTASTAANRFVFGGYDLTLMAGTAILLTYDGTSSRWRALSHGRGRLAFPATQVSSADPNTLDDYEEGTWTPALTFGGGSTGLTYTTQTGTYTKIGRLVIASCQIVINAKGSSTGAAVLNGLPFTSSGPHAAAFWAQGVTVTGSTGIEALTNNSTTLLLYANGTQLTDTAFTAGSNLVVTMTYQTST